MNSGFVHNGLSGCGCKKGLADTFTADQIAGNRLKLKKSVTAYIGHPGSSQTETWDAGFVTPQVYSYVEKPDGLYWMIGEIQPIRYLKHDSKAFEVVPDSGGSQYLAKPDKSIFDNLGLGFGEFEINRDQLIIAGLFVAGVVVAVPATSFLIKKALTNE